MSIYSMSHLQLAHQPHRELQHKTVAWACIIFGWQDGYLAKLLYWPMTIHKQLPPISCSVLLGQLACIGSLGTQLAAKKICIGPTI